MSLTNAIPEMERDLRFHPATTTDPKHLTRDQVAQYNEKGYVYPLDLFSADEAVANRAYFEHLMQLAADNGHNQYSINCWHDRCGGIWDLAMEPRILDLVEDLLGPDLVCTMTHYFAKMPGDGKQVSWHQDASYWPLTPSKVVTVWLAIDDVDDDNGPMMFIPGSHVHGQIPFDKSTDEDHNVLNQSVRDPEAWGDAPVAVTMKAGQVSLHTDLLLHGSGYNGSDRRRCGLTLRYHPPDVRRREPDAAPGIICRGSDPSGYWQPVPRADGDNVPERR
jgi:non-heme Fe2+,alpha-ketoglutarate-dependent halogenase